MMGFENGVVTLNRDSHIYCSGETINGNLSFSLDKFKVIHGIYVETKGYRKIHWTTERRSCLLPRVSYTEDHYSYEVCFRRTTFLCGGVTGNYLLRPGKHEFKFNCPIPAYCPSSFEGRHGHIRYCFNIVMLNTGIFSSDKRIVIPFGVHSKQANKPIEFQLDDNWCISVEYSQMPVKLAAGSYGPGRGINLEVVCKNKNTSNIKKVVFPMKQSLTSKATQSIAPAEPATCKTSSDVAEIKKASIPARAQNWVVEFQPIGAPPSYWCAVSKPVPCAAENMNGSTEIKSLDSMPEVPSNQQPYNPNCMRNNNENKED